MPVTFARPHPCPPTRSSGSARRCATGSGRAFRGPTTAQAQGWEAISAGQHTLIHAPTGSGKTLAAFLWCIDRLTRTDARPAPTGERQAGVRVLYVSPLKALAYDIERNLRAPLAGIGLAAARLGEPAPPTSASASRTGDTPAEERRQMTRRPPDILITTPGVALPDPDQPGARDPQRPSSTSSSTRSTRSRARKRGAHLALILERLEAPRPPAPPQRIGLSATQRPLETRSRASSAASGEGRDVTIVDAGARKPLELQVVVPVEDMSRLGEPLPLEEQPGGPAAGAEAG